MKKIVVFLAVLFFALAITFGIKAVKNADGRTNGTSVAWNEEIETFACSISKNSQNDREKVTAFYDWIIKNISYDYDAQPIYQHFNFNKTIKTKKGLCYDYSNLFAVLCRSQKIPCYILDGYSRENYSYYHSWNRVYFDNTWWNVDITFDAQQIKESEELYGFKSVGEDYTVEDSDLIITRIY